MTRGHEHWRAFDAAWFRRHQRRLLWWLNGPLGVVLRLLLRLEERAPLSGIGPHWHRVAVTAHTGRVAVRTHPKFAKRLYYALAPLWWAMHFFDWVALDRWVPRLSFGFATLTGSPQAGNGGGNVTTDGPVTNYFGSPVNWADARGTAGYQFVEMTEASPYACRVSRTGTNLWAEIIRGGYSFDTSTIPVGSTIDAVTLSLVGIAASATAGMDGTSWDVVAWTPANKNTQVVADFTQYGTTSFANLTYAAFTTSRNTFTLNASGRATIVAGGVSAFGTRVNADLTGTEPAGTGAGAISYQVSAADTTGTASDPILEVTYTTPSGSTNVVLRAPSALTNIVLTSGGTTTPCIYLNVGGTSKRATAVYVNVAGASKQLTDLSANVGGVRKDVVFS